MRFSCCLFLLFLFAGESSAFSCRVNGVPFQNGSVIRIDVPLGPEIVSGKNNIIDFSKYVDCSVTGIDYGYKDTLKTYSISGDGGALVFQNKLAGKNGGAIIDGKQYDIPVPGGVQVLYLTDYNKYIPLPVMAYLNVSNSPNGLDIKAGDLLMSLKIRQTNNIDETSNTYTWNVYSQNDTFVSLSTCKINNNGIMDIDFKSVNSADIEQGKNDYAVKKDINYSCDSSINQRVAVTIKGDSSNNDLLKTSINGLNIEMQRNGAKIKPNVKFYTDLVNGVANDELLFKLSKDVNYKDHIDTGIFKSSAIMVMENN